MPLRLVGEIVQDAKHPSMWRVRQPNGSLSDMVNRTRAKDACAAMAATAERRGRQSRTEDPQTRFSPPPLPNPLQAEINASSSAA
jgi:hypothetical protein